MRLPLRFPDLALPSTRGSPVNLSRLQGRVVVFCYPYTGKPGVPDPPGWDDIPGAHGSTPQALGYAQRFAEFRFRSVEIFGLSTQDSAWQTEFATRNNLPFALLSDADRQFSKAMQLQIFHTGGTGYLVRTTFLADAGQVIWRNTEIPNPAMDAERTLGRLHT